MAFSQTTISEVSPPVFQGGSVWLSWTSSSPANTWFQVYIDGALAWYGTARQVAIPAPRQRVRVEIGTVAAGEQTTDFSASLPAAPSPHAHLSWQGGSFQGDDLAGFRVYGESSPGAGISYTTPLATVPAYTGGLPLDGFGLGGYGQGGFGRAAGTYTWESGPLTSGVWSFGIKPVDTHGNEGTATTGTVTIVAPPHPPARNAVGQRLQYVYDSVTKTVALSWLESSV